MTEKGKDIKKVPNLRFPGFEQGWGEKKLGEIGEIITGNTPSTANKEFYNGSYLFVSPVDINNSRWLNKTKTTLTELGFSKGRKIRKGSSLFVCIGSTIGKVAQTSAECITNQQINTIVPFNNDDDFVYTLLERHSSKIKMLAAEQAIPIINKSTFSNYLLNLPTLTEQTRIASFFSAIDERISTQSKIIEQLKSLMHGTREQLLTRKIKFRDRNDNDFPEWKVKKLGEIATKKASNISANSLNDNNGRYKIYGATGVLKNIDFYNEEEEYVSIVKDGAGVGRLFLCEAKTSVLGTLDVIKNNELSNLKFLYYVLGTLNFSKYTAGSTIPHIYFKDYSNEIIGLPSLTEQAKIADLLFSIDEKIEMEKQLLERYERQKKYLLANLFI